MLASACNDNISVFLMPTNAFISFCLKDLQIGCSNGLEEGTSCASIGVMALMESNLNRLYWETDIKTSCILYFGFC